MGTLNLLESVGYIGGVILDKIDIKSLSWIGKIIQWLIEGVGIVGLGVVVFTLILKTIVLPLDVYSRVKTKKQSLIMKEMRPQMEKLQKQYANDKQMYSQKVMELQKANGYSMFGACIPMIVSLVIFMVVFSAFSTYSQYANLSTYNNMVEEYNASVKTFVCQTLDGENENENGFLIEVEDGAAGGIAYKVDFNKFADCVKNDNAADYELPENYLSLTESEKQVYVTKYVRLYARQASASYYNSNKTTFIWVKNIWYPDSMLNKEIPAFSKFSSSVSRAIGTGVDASYEDSYNEVMFNLSKEQNTYNGYFVLIVLAIGMMFLQQFIMMRSQKDAAELGSVDGTAAKTNKWMMIMMPLIYGVFSFFYSAAFSIYMITNTCYGLITTLIINKVTEARFAKQIANGEFNKKRAKKGINNRKRLK
ncbi:MAG: YidC/Oxa1 family membrane protein insertase [Clostridia bacterium]|nr:YidC/Oxa1 family membrane protein insertase [Clostridia bacterium]